MHRFQDAVMNSEFQHDKKHQDEKLSMPDESPITTHAAETLCQVEGADTVEGGWVSSDAWFSRVSSCIEITKRFKAHSTLIVKNNTGCFPMKVLCNILQVQF